MITDSPKKKFLGGDKKLGSLKGEKNRQTNTEQGDNATMTLNVRPKSSWTMGQGLGKENKKNRMEISFAGP